MFLVEMVHLEPGFQIFRTKSYQKQPSSAHDVMYHTCVSCEE